MDDGANSTFNMRGKNQPEYFMSAIKYDVYIGVVEP